MSRRTLFAVVSLALVCLIPTSAPRAQEGWERIAVLGVNTRVIGFGSTGVVFAGTEGHGMWRSLDDGTTWVQSTDPVLLTTATIADLVVSPNYSSDKTVFCVTTDGFVYRCTDGSSTFTFVKIKGKDTDRSEGTSLAIHPAYLGGGTGGNQTLFAGYAAGDLYYSNDAGAATPTWTRDNSTNTMAQIWDLAISPTFGTDGKLFVGGKADNGPLKLWTGPGSMVNRYTGLGTANNSEVVKALYWAGGNNVWAGTRGNGLYISANEGANWAAGCDGATNNALPQVNAIARYSGAGPFLLEGRADAPYKSTDVGGTGSTCATYSPATPIQEVELQPSYNGTSRCYIYFGTPSGLLRKSTCATGLKRGPQVVDGYDVALALSGRGKFMGSREEGLFKCVSTYTDPGNMVRYNNFPNKKTPSVVAICLDPAYDETYDYGTIDCGSQDQSILFVAADFPEAPQDNGVYKSKDFGNTWTKMTLNWPTSAITVYDLAISPQYQDDGSGTKDVTLFAATSGGLYRWDGGTAGWQFKSTGIMAEIIAVGLPPSYGKDLGVDHHTVVVGVFDASLEYHVYKNDTDGDGTWTSLNYTTTTKRGRVTGFAFARQYPTTSNSIWVSSVTDPYQPSESSPSKGGLYRYILGTGWTKVFPTGASAYENVWDVAAEPKLWDSGSYYRMLIATTPGIFKTADANSSAPTWDIKDRRSAYSLIYDLEDSAGNFVMAGFQGNPLGNDPGTGTCLSLDQGDSWPLDFWGYHYLPDDVWASVAHERDPDILFSSSPSMGVFVSEDKGISFRPWNKGFGGTVGPCPLRTGLGINMLAGRRNDPDLDIVWVGTAEEGIKARYIFYDTSTTPATIDLETSDGVDANGWRHNTWTGSGATIDGRWERIEVIPNTGMTYPVWATGQAWGSNSAQGMAVLPAGPWWSVWRAQNTGLPASPDTRGVRQGFQSLQSGTPISGESVPYHQWNYYQVQVPSGTSDLRAYMDDLDDGGALDPDLYLRHGALPTLDLWDYRPWINGDETVCVNPASDILLNQPFGTLLNESFTGGIPGSWAIVDGGTGGGSALTWTAGNPCSRAIGAPFSSPFAIVDSDCAGSAAVQDESLITPTLNCSMSEQVVLVFDNQFHWIGGYGDDVAYVDVSSDGGTNWTNALTMTGADDGYATPNTKSVDLSVWASGKSSVKVRFRYTGAYDYWWAIDNVRVYELTKPWFIQHNGAGTGASSTWSVGNPCGAATLGAPMSAPYAVVDTTCSGGGIAYQEYLKGPSFNASAYAKVNLTFDYRFNNSGTGASFRVYGSTDGGATWYGYYIVPGNAAPGPYSINVSSFMAGKSNCAFRFAFLDDATTPGRWVALDNIQVTGQGPKPGTWYIGIYGYAGSNSTYSLTATLNSGCTPLIAPPTGDGKREERAESGTEEGVPNPDAPSTSTSWGTVNASGVYQGVGSPSALPEPGAVVWTQRNGTTSPLTNLYANTVVQLSDLTVITGCTGDVFYSPAPDEGQTTWVNATANVASAGSNDFRDLLVASNGDVLIAASGTGTGTSAGGVWLSGDAGAHWMRLSQGFDSDSQELTDLMADGGSPPSYYSSTGATGEYTRTITADPYPTVTSVNPATGPATGGTPVTIAGTGFLGACPTGTASDCPSPNNSPVVLFGDTPVVPTGWSATSITCTTPAGSAGGVKVTVRNPDTRRSTTGPTFTYACAAPDAPVITSCTDYSPYHFTGIQVLWNSPATWGDSGSTSRSLAFYRDGTVNTTLAYSTTSRTDSPATKCTPHTYKLRAANSCGLTSDSGSATATDDAEAGAENSGAALVWNAAGKTQLGWGDVTGATSYTLYRGDGSSVSNLASGGASVCVAYSGATSDSGAILSSSPGAGQFYWYLAAASAGVAEGTLGTGTGGTPRLVTSTGACGTP